MLCLGYLMPVWSRIRSLSQTAIHRTSLTQSCHVRSICVRPRDRQTLLRATCRNLLRLKADSRAAASRPAES
eukprot:3842562-Pyramimonas_sp.AAC.1